MCIEIAKGWEAMIPPSLYVYSNKISDLVWSRLEFLSDCP